MSNMEIHDLIVGILAIVVGSIFVAVSIKDINTDMRKLKNKPSAK
jgi:hypothetical protein